MKPAKNDLYDRFGHLVEKRFIEQEFVNLDSVQLKDKHLYVPYAKTDHPVYSPWLEPEFEKNLALAQHGLLSSAKLAFLTQLLRNIAHWDGEIWECGVLNGTTARILSDLCPYTTMRLFDTFNGLAGCTENDVLKDGDFQGATMRDVQALLPNAHIHAGKIPDTFKFIPAYSHIIFAHIDLDIYQPTLDALEAVYPRMHSGYIVIDDYGNWATPGVKKAVDEFFEDKMEVIITQVTSQALIIKGHKL